MKEKILKVRYLVFILFAVKMFVYYIAVDIPIFSSLSYWVTLVFFGLTMYLYYYSTVRTQRILRFVYAIFSIVLFIDVIYYNPDDLSIDADLLYYEKIHSFVEKNHLPYLVDVSNEARMHLWKEKKEEVRVRPYRSSEDAISRWIATVHAVGITKSGNHLQVFAPYGLSDIFSRTIRPIKHEGNSKELYEKKANSWRQRFPNVHIVPW